MKKNFHIVALEKNLFNNYIKKNNFSKTGVGVGNVLTFSFSLFFSPLCRVKYAALSFSPSHSNNSDNTRSGVESVTYTQDSQGVTLATGEISMSNTSSSSQPDWRTNYRGDYKDKNLRPICTQDLTSWAFQVARGMEYLSDRKVSFFFSKQKEKNFYVSMLFLQFFTLICIKCMSFNVICCSLFDVCYNITLE